MSKNKKYTAIIDDVMYSEKPVGEAQSIVVRIVNKGNKEYTLDEIADAISSGKTIVPFKFDSYRSGKIKGKFNKYFKGTNLLMIDIDEGMTIEEMLKMHEDIGVKPNMYYKSFSHSSTHHKFRVVYCLPYMIRSQEEYRLLWDTFDKFYKEGSILDRTMDVSRMYYGSNQKAEILSYEPFDIVTLADKMETLLSADEKELKLKTAKIVGSEVYENIPKMNRMEMLKSKMIRDFENGDLRNKGDYHKVRSLAFVYHYLGQFDRFLDLAPLNKSKYPREKWVHDLEADLKAGRTGHTYTYSVLKEIGAFDKYEESRNRDVIVSNYLDNRLKVLQCYKELDIKIDKYLPVDKIEEIVKQAGSGSRILIIADTGTGKTYSIISAFRNLGMKCILSVPNRMNAQQNMEKYKIGGAFAEHPIQSAMQNNDIVCAVWEMLGTVDLDYHEHILVNDEAHAHVHDSSFRGHSIQGVTRVSPRFRGIIDITATPTGLDLTQYTHIYRFVSKNEIDYKVKVYVGYNETDRVVTFARSEGKALILENKKKNLQYYKATLEYETGQKAYIVTSEGKEDNESFISIATKERLLPDTKYMLCTTVLTAGVNILDEDITDIFIVGFKSVTTIKQFIARARNVKKMNIHIFVSEGSKDYYTFNIYDERRIEASILERRVSEIDTNMERDLLDTETSLRRAKLKREKMQIEEDYQKLDEELWRRYYVHLSIKNFITALEEFFSDIELVWKEYEMDEIAKDFKDLLKEEEEESTEIVYYNINQLFESDGKVEDSDTIGMCLGYLDSLPKGSRMKVYKRLSKLYPEEKPIDIRLIKDYEKYGDIIKDYAYYRSEGLSHKLSVSILKGEKDFHKLRAQLTALMFLSNREKWKKNSPAYLLIETVADMMPKNQSITEDLMRDLCSRIDGREYVKGDRYSNTIKEICKVIDVKKNRKTGMYDVGGWLHDVDIDSSVILKVEQSHLLDSIETDLKRSIKERRMWLDLSEKYLEMKKKVKSES